MKYAVSSYSFHSKIQSGEMTQLDTVRAAAEMGFDGIEFIDLTPCQNPTLADQLAYAKEIAQEATARGIEVVAYTVGANLFHTSAEASEREVSRMCGQIDVAHALGARVCRHDVCYSHVHNARAYTFEQMLPTIAANARRITEYAADLGIRTCTENHGYIAQDSDRVERLLSAVDHANYGLLIDIGNFACADEDSARAVSRLAPFAIHVHAKDFYVRSFGKEPLVGSFNTRGMRSLLGCAIGDGDIPVAHCLAILKRAGYDGYLSVEYEGRDDCMQGIARGLAYLKKHA